jgi:PadR family transcriptional regulator PadR
MRKTGHWLHGFLDLCLLALLRHGPDYGFGLAQRLSAAGFGEVPGGTLYPALLRLEQQGWVSVRWAASESGPRRKYYELTESGLDMLDRDATGWRRFRDGIDGLLDALPDAPPGDGPGNDTTVGSAPGPAAAGPAGPTEVDGGR